MASVYGQDIPPSLVTAYTKCIGPPKESGFAIFLPNYPGLYGRTVGRRHPFRFPPRQGYTSFRITAPQAAQRLHFRAALDLWAQQPYTTPADALYGAKGHNIWWQQGVSFGMWGINYFMSRTVPLKIADEPAPWDPALFMNLFAGHAGDNSGYAVSALLPAATYRVELLRAGQWHVHNPIQAKSAYVYAVSVSHGTSDSATFDAHIGVLTPDASHNYENWNQLPENEPDAWTEYTDNSDPRYVDVTVDGTERILLQFLNLKVGDPYTRYGSLQASITEQP